MNDKTCTLPDVICMFRNGILECSLDLESTSFGSSKGPCNGGTFILVGTGRPTGLGLTQAFQPIKYALVVMIEGYYLAHDINFD